MKPIQNGKQWLLPVVSCLKGLIHTGATVVHNWRYHSWRPQRSDGRTSVLLSNTFTEAKWSEQYYTEVKVQTYSVSNVLYNKKKKVLNQTKTNSETKPLTNTVGYKSSRVESTDRLQTIKK